MNEDHKQRIEKLKSRLHSRDYSDTRTGERSFFTKKEHEGSTDWNSEESIQDLLSQTPEIEKKSL